MSEVRKYTRRPSRIFVALIASAQSLEERKLMRKPSGERSKTVAKAAIERSGPYVLVAV